MGERLIFTSPRLVVAFIGFAAGLRAFPTIPSEIGGIECRGAYVACRRAAPSKIATFVERGSRARFSTYVEVYGLRIMGCTLEVIEFRASGKMRVPAVAFSPAAIADDFIHGSYSRSKNLGSKISG